MSEIFCLMSFLVGPNDKKKKRKPIIKKLKLSMEPFLKFNTPITFYKNKSILAQNAMDYKLCSL